MCGIVGLYLKSPGLRCELGGMFTPMLIEMTDRGPDSAGLAVYRNPVDAGRTKITAFHPDEAFDWAGLQARLEKDVGGSTALAVNASHCVIETGADATATAATVEGHDPLLQVMSSGDAIEIYKETGLPEDVARRFHLREMAGTHAIGHTRMATESAVTTAGSHPFSTGRDLCLVHNGSLSNHNNLREMLRNHKGEIVKTENDTEVGAAFISCRLKEGATLHRALEDCLETLDGFYTFVAGARDGFAVLRDPIACKPAVLAETDDYVAFGSEYRALATLPDIGKAKVWEPEPAVVYSWERQADAA